MTMDNPERNCSCSSAGEIEGIRTLNAGAGHHIGIEARLDKSSLGTVSAVVAIYSLRAFTDESIVKIRRRGDVLRNSYHALPRVRQHQTLRKQRQERSLLRA